MTEVLHTDTTTNISTEIQTEEISENANNAEDDIEIITEADFKNTTPTPTNPNSFAESPLSSVSENEASTEDPSSESKIREKEALKMEKLKQKELKKLQKEEEKKRKEEERERAKRELELKKDQLKKEKEEKEKQRLQEKQERERKKQLEKEEKERKRLEEKEEKERKRLEEKEEREKKRLEEKLKREEERLKKELEKKEQEEQKKREEEEQQKKRKKLQISNFFAPKNTIKSTPSVVSDSSTSDYSKAFHKFYIKSNSTLHSFELPKETLRNSTSDFDSQLNPSSSIRPSYTFQRNSFSTQQIISKTLKESGVEDQVLRFKFVKFYEHLRSYFGTYTKSSVKELALNPFKDLNQVFIDWDQEADIDEEGEGEDISDNDEEEEEDLDEENDLDDFLIEDLSEANSSRKVLGPLIPKIQWKQASVDNIRIEILKQNIQFPISPIENYWSDATSSPKKNSVVTSEDSPKPKKPKSLITDKESLLKFAKEVDGNDFTVSTMVEVLKKDLPSYTKLTIENTLKHLAKRVGPKPTEKKWEVDKNLLSKLIEQT